MQQAASRPQNTADPRFQSLVVPVLRADTVWELLLGIGLILAAVGSVTRPLGAAALQPRFIPAVVGVGCLGLAAFVLYASKQPQADAAAACRPLAAANLCAAALAIGLMIGFPGAGHPYVVALAIASTGCAMFATVEWVIGRPAGRSQKAGR
jgi:hypothetical protein